MEYLQSDVMEWRSAFEVAYDLRRKVSASCVSKRDGTRRLTFAPPEQTRKRTRSAARDTKRRLNFAHRNDKEDSPQGKGIYHPHQTDVEPNYPGPDSTLEPFGLSAVVRYTSGTPETLTAGRN